MTPNVSEKISETYRNIHSQLSTVL